MPSYKNQHFVPKAHLRPFAFGDELAAINLLLIEQDRVVEGAPLKHQCARNYFYGNSPELEHGLGEIESLYALTVKRITSGLAPTVEDYHALKIFWALQYSRTEGAIRRQMESSLVMATIAHSGTGRDPPPDEHNEKDYALRALEFGVKSSNHVLDMSCAIVRNRTASDFITSDDPAVLTNILHLQHYKQMRGFGLISSGALAIIPLGPRYAFIAYDKNVYSIQKESGFLVDVKRRADVIAINEHQVLKASKCLYFKSMESLAAIRDLVAVARGRRIHPQEYLRFVQDGPRLTNGANYRLANEEDFARTTTSKFIMVGSQFATPSGWPSFVKMRRDAFGFVDGTVAGIVRLPDELRAERQAVPVSAFTPPARQTVFVSGPNQKTRDTNNQLRHLTRKFPWLAR